MEGLIDVLKYLAIDNSEKNRNSPIELPRIRNSPIELPSGLSDFEQNIF